MRGFELPAHNGLTHVLDKGLGPRGWEDVLEVGRRAHLDRQARLGHARTSQAISSASSRC